MKFDPQNTPSGHLHHRHSIRLKEYDYAQPGGYFITIVTYHRDSLFGEIWNKVMQLNGFGKIADECWRAIPEHFPNVELGAYVVMRNHVHGIIVINDGADASASARRGTIYRAPTEQFGKPVAGSIPTVIRTFKSAVSRRIGREHNVTGIWQRNYYEHVIRDDKDWDRIHRYIESNPSMWAEDEENPMNL
jgi:REP element-mobilizing transposase RayT